MLRPLPSASLISLLVSAACSGGPSNATARGAGGVEPGVIAAPARLEARSGTRLKANWYVGADGGRAAAGWPLGWTDTLAMTFCLFRGGHGDRYVCGPDAAFAPIGSPLLFADEGCTEPLIAPDGNGPRPSWLALPGSCPAQSGLYEPDPDAAPV